ncbi:DUF2985 domain-containing protein [Aspergillus niger CBS 101883]|uniref:DUF2985 domain-containing protein n=1 Tax=Aspergillus lacticoffeatus (strain CBS 101883) TaxID=1450533 RepID=UPI000D7F4158|nr:uncharacterized protein BO96DRAFT_397286 [Aspergillus niger CBS 101883]PYH54674.1 hypothetical protein BO96DRAFT_397286 [Aspergillus niger CBS 101883]
MIQQAYRVIDPQNGSLPSSLEKKEIESEVEIPVPKATKLRIWVNHAWHWIATPKGFFITIYSLNVVAWGGMLFLLMCNAAPAMCHPTCNDLYSSRRIWIEITSQILNGLFCVTGFGFAPWRLRNLYWWFCWRFGARQKSRSGIAHLASIYQAWCRPPESVSGICRDNDRECGPATSPWKIDLVVWCDIWNTIFQACLAGCMWGMDRFNRPSWTTGLFVGLACGVAGISGYMVFHETRKLQR